MFHRLGLIIDFLSKATLIGFMAGAAIIVSLQQLKSLLGIVHFTKQMGLVPVLASVFHTTNEVRPFSLCFFFYYLFLFTYIFIFLCIYIYLYEQWSWQTIVMGMSFLGILLLARHVVCVSLFLLLFIYLFIFIFFIFYLEFLLHVLMYINAPFSINEFVQEEQPVLFLLENKFD